MTETDLPFLQHMLDAVERLQRYLDGVDQDEFEENEVLQDAVVRQLEILGEAASRVDADRRRSLPDIPWSKVISTRNRLIHGHAACWKQAPRPSAKAGSSVDVKRNAQGNSIRLLGES